MAEKTNNQPNIILLMGLFPLQIRKDIELNSKGNIQYAADALQWSLVKGLDSFFDFKLINLPYIGSFPFRFKSLKYYDFSFKINKRANSVNIGFLNLPIIKMYSRYKNTKKELIKTLSQFNGKTIIIIYSVNSPFLKSSLDVKKAHPNVEICLIVPDIPEHMSDSKNFFYQLLKRIDGIFIEKALKEVESFVLLSDYMTEPLQIDRQPYVRIEGIYNPSDSPSSVLKEKNKTILYSGTLARRYGVRNLIEAFREIDNANYRLWICGDGDCREEIQNLVKVDNRVTYFNQIPRSEVLILQKKATVLVNPRTSEGEFTKLSFPSKILEYLASGTPCIMHPLKGIPDEYFPYCYISDVENAKGLKDMILTVCEKDQLELDKFGEKAKQFIEKHKNPTTQVKKIYDMLMTTSRKDLKI